MDRRAVTGYSTAKPVRPTSVPSVPVGRVRTAGIVVCVVRLGTAVGGVLGRVGVRAGSARTRRRRRSPGVSLGRTVRNLGQFTVYLSVRVGEAVRPDDCDGRETDERDDSWSDER